MNERKRIWHRFLFPPGAVVAVLVPVAAVLLVFVLTQHSPAPALAYASYLLSAYALALICARIPAFQRWLLSLPQLQRYRADARLRVAVSLHVSLTLNVPYAAMQFWLGLRQGAAWFYVLAGYYTLLAVMRHLLLRYIRMHKTGRDHAAEFRLYRLCGTLLLMMTFVLVVVVYYTVWQDRGLRHHPIATIAMAAYTFFTLTLAIVNDVRYRRESPVLSAARTIRMAAALVSVLSLTAAMLATFGGGAAFRRWLLAAAGSTICAIVLTTAIGMIARANAALRRQPPASRRAR